MMTFHKLELILILWSPLTMKQSKRWIFLVTQKIQMKARICLGPLYLVKCVTAGNGIGCLSKVYVINGGGTQKWLL